MGQEIGGEQDYARYYDGLMKYVNGIQRDHKPCHFAIKSNFFPIAYTFNFVVPMSCPEFFWDRNAEITPGWKEYSMDDFIDRLPDQFQFELEHAMVKGMLERIEEHGTGPGTRYFTTVQNHCWITSARMIVIVGVEKLADLPGFSKPLGDGYTQGVSHKVQL